MSEVLNVVRLAEYQPSAFTVDHHELCFILDEEETRVIHQQTIRRVQAKIDGRGWTIPQQKDLVLDGEGLSLQRILVDDEPLSDEDFCYENNQLTLFQVKDAFTLTTEGVLHPEKNSELSGLYRSNGVFCSQCEAQGFRRISFTLDRPDVLSTYRVRIEADKTRYPVLLSNGNPEEQGELANGRHYVQWFDPHPKPTYLFALVAGDLAMLSKRLKTPQGKQIDLRIYTEKAFIDQTDHAMQSLVEAILWDEKRFNLTYDLDRFNIVAVSDFNMGAMENKSLNIFNTKYVLSSAETSTDDDFHGVQSVIGHEYFHNWTGNRITCRDWFQLSLKEGLTVFRDQEFSADMNERDLERINQVRNLRQVQFAEDGGPMRHPVQPQEYAAIDNFYTATVYEKGAEIIRMMHTIIGEDDFQKGMALYVSRHDGQAVRIEDFAQCMEDASGYPFSKQFFDWYTTAGTPRLTFTSAYNQREQRYTFSAHQDISAVSPQRALVVPIRLSLISPTGRAHRFPDGSYETLLMLDQSRGSWSFEKASADLIPVVMQGFSAPVYYEHNYTNDELSAIVLHAPDGFARYEAMQMRMRRLFMTALKRPRELKDHLREVTKMMQAVLANDKRSNGEKALLLTTPRLVEFLPYLPAPVDMDRAIAAYDRIVCTLAIKMRRQWMDFLENSQSEISPRYNVKEAGIRALRSVCLRALAVFNESAIREMLADSYHNAPGMACRVNYLTALMGYDDECRRQPLADFYSKFADQPLVVDKWFALQAGDETESALENIIALSEHPAFSYRNPNRFRALIATLIARNPKVFHQADGQAYRWVIARIRQIILENPQLAARMLSGFASVARLDEARKSIVAEQLQAVAEMEGLSVDVKEVLERILAGLS